MNNANPFMPNAGAKAPTGSTPNVPQGPAPTMAGQMPGNVTFELDLTNVENGFTVPDGDYHLRCIDCEQGVSQAGNPQIALTRQARGACWQGKLYRMTPAPQEGAEGQARPLWPDGAVRPPVRRSGREALHPEKSTYWH